MQHPALLLPKCATLGLLASATACSWSRFDNVAEDAPIVLLEKSSEVGSGFGSSLATASAHGEVRLLATAPAESQGGAVYNLGTGDQPAVNAMDSGHCAPEGDPCYLARHTAALPSAVRRGQSEPLELCFVAGIGSKGDTSRGLLARCDDKTEYILPVPEGSIADAVESAFTGRRGATVVLGADRGEAPALVAGFPNIHRAWFYHSLSAEARELVAPGSEPDDSYGSSVAVVRLDSAERIFAVGALGERHVWLFRAAPDEDAYPVGCLGGPRGFGRTLASGRVGRDSVDELVVADAVNVTVFDGQGLSQLPAAGSPDCSLAALPATTVVTAFGCGSSPDVTGCDDSAFGAALAVGDLDGDGDGEVIVGAPRLTVRGEADAGAVLVYDAEGESRHELTEVKFISSAQSGDLLGSAIATPRLQERDVVAAGAPGGGKVAIFYCSERLPARELDSRCQ